MEARMRCPVCHALHHEYNQLDEVEAKVILAQWHDLTRTPSGEETILLSRRSRLQVLARIEQHRASAHAAVATAACG